MKQARHESNLVWKWKNGAFSTPSSCNFLVFLDTRNVFIFFPFFLFDLPFVRLKMINENQPNHSIKLAFISLVCFFLFFFLCVSFVCFLCAFCIIKRCLCKKENDGACFQKSVKKVKIKVIFTVDEDIYSFRSFQPIHFSQSQRERWWCTKWNYNFSSSRECFHCCCLFPIQVSFFSFVQRWRIVRLLGWEFITYYWAFFLVLENNDFQESDLSR